MSEHAPSPEAVRLIARILGARQTIQEEVPDVIATVHQALATLGRSDEASAAAWEVDAGEQLEQTVPERRSRARRERAVFAAPTEPMPVAAAPQLMRRTDVARTPAAPTEAAAKTRTALRGIVKWYDPRNRAGALRLPGHDDVAIDADALERAGVPRLFKGQEIEASIVVEADGAVRLLAMSLPGRPETEPVPMHGASPRRAQKPVVIEMKRDALKRVGARIEAEQLLGPRR
jgi:cold shock CspA family protein